MKGKFVILQQAWDIADKMIKEIHAGEVELQIGAVQKFSDAWLFAFNTVEFYNGDITKAFIGNPVVVPFQGDPYFSPIEGPTSYKDHTPLEEVSTYIPGMSGK